MITTILVDDEPLTTKALRKVIEDNFGNIEVMAETTNGLKAWELMMQAIPDFIIVDVRMPIMNGLELVQKMRDTQIQTKVIVLTAHSEFEYARKAIQLGAFGYLLKPILQTELIDEINRMIQVCSNEREMIDYKLKVSKVLPIVEEHVVKKLLAGKMNTEELKEYFEIDGGTWDHCYVSVFQMETVDQKTVEIEEVAKISITEEINSYIHENYEHGICLFRKSNEVVIVLNNEMTSSFYPSLVTPLLTNCIKIIDKYASGYVSVGIGKVGYPLQDLAKAYGEAKENVTDHSLKSVPQGETIPPYEPQEKLIQKMISYCEQNYLKDITLEKAAEHIHMNKYYFCNIFKSKTGINFWDYITNLRITKAKDLLKNTELKIHDIALLVGYINSSHFGRIFKETVGATPAEFRRKC